MSQSRNVAETGHLLECGNNLQQNPNRERAPRRNLNPVKASEKAESRLWELEGVKGNHAGDATAGANRRNMRPRFHGHSQNVATERCKENQQTKFHCAKKVFDGIDK